MSELEQENLTDNTTTNETIPTESMDDYAVELEASWHYQSR